MQPIAEAGELELRDYLRVLRRRKWIIALVTVAAVAVAVGVSLLQTPVYRATAEVLLQARTSEQIFSPDPQANVAQQARVETEIEVMKSRSVLDPVTEALGFEPDVSISAQGETDVVSISASDTDPAKAALIADTYAQTYVTVRRQALVDDLLAAATEVQGQLNEIDAEIAEVEAPIAALDAQIAATTDEDELAALLEQRDQLERQTEGRLEALQNRRAIYADQLDELQLATNLTETGGAQIVSDAQVPTSPFKPTPRRNGIVAAVVGLLLGVGLAFLREYLDDTIKTKDDLDSAAPGVNVLSLVPVVTTWKDRAEPVLAALTTPSSAAAEAYRTLRTSLQFIGIEQPVGVTQFTSPSAAEGKTTTLANLGVVLAQAGQRVILVDCDLRRPRLHRFFGLDNDVGLTSALLGDVTLAEATRTIARDSFLAVLPSGPVPINPSELLSSPRTAELLKTLREECDFVLVDSPPVLPVTDAIVIAGVADATVLVVTADSTTKRDTHRAVEVLRQVDAPLIGTVLNGIDPESGYGYQYGYRYAYRDGQSQRRPANGARRASRMAEERGSDRGARVDLPSDARPGT